jgi:hypothetical protein
LAEPAVAAAPDAGDDHAGEVAADNPTNAPV